MSHVDSHFSSCGFVLLAQDQTLYQRPYPLRYAAIYLAAGVLAGAGSAGAAAAAGAAGVEVSTGAAPVGACELALLADHETRDVPAGGAAGSLVEGAAALSVGVGLGTAAAVPLVSVLVPAVPVPLFLRLNKALILSIASRAGK